MQMTFFQETTKDLLHEKGERTKQFFCCSDIQCLLFSAGPRQVWTASFVSFAGFASLRS